MSEKINEQISALLDGELPEAELSLLLGQIAKQPILVQQAQCVQQARLCLQGEKPSSSITSALRFTARIHDAVRDEPEFPVYDLARQGLTHPHSLSAQSSTLSQAALGAGLVEKQEHSTEAAFSAQDINISQAAANEPGKWRPLFGAGVAAAVAMVAVSAWQSQSSLEQESAGPDASLSVQAPFDQGATNIPSAPSAMSAQATPASASVSVNNAAESSAEASENSYTVPEISGLNNVDTPFALQGDFRQAKYSSYLLQNQVAPQSTSSHLSQYAQQLRTRQAQQIFIDPRTGLVVISTGPKENR